MANDTSRHLIHDVVTGQFELDLVCKGYELVLDPQPIHDAYSEYRLCCSLEDKQCSFNSLFILVKQFNIFGVDLIVAFYFTHD